MKLKLKELVDQIPKQSLAIVLKSKHREVYEWVLSETDDTFLSFNERVHWLLSPSDLYCEFGRRKKFVPNKGSWGFCGKPDTCECHKTAISNRSKEATVFKSAEFFEQRKKQWQERYGVDNIQQLAQYKEAARQRNLGKTHSSARLEEYRQSGLDDVLSRLDTEGFIPLFGKSEYFGSSRFNVYPWECKTCGTSVSSHIDYGTVPRCPNCKPKTTSLQEHQLREYLDSLGVSYITNTRNVIPPQELDIYIPEKNLAIEINGMYWHSSIKRPPEYHIDKTLACLEKGVKLIHVFESQWNSKADIVKARLKNILGVDKKYYARKADIRHIDSRSAKLFLNTYHIQGDSSSSINLGLFISNELVAVMTFGLSRYDKACDYELHRYCSKNTVIGGAGKLFSFFLKTYNPDKIVSYADRCWSDGGLYRTLGFSDATDNIRNIGYFYHKNGVDYHRSTLTKKRLVNMGFDPNKTADQILEEAGYLKIYNCGNYKFIYSKT